MTAASLLCAAALWWAPRPASAAPPEATPQTISAEFAVPAGRVRKIHDRDRLSYPEIRTALILSRETGQSLDEVVGLKRAGVSFEEIAARHRLDLDEVLASYERDRERRHAEPEASREAPRSVPEAERPVINPPLPPSPEAPPGELQERPVWDSPSNPFVQQQWNDQGQWRLDRARPGFPQEQVGPSVERQSR